MNWMPRGSANPMSIDVLGIGFVAVNYATAPTAAQAGSFSYGVNKNIE